MALLKIAFPNFESSQIFDENLYKINNTILSAPSVEVQKTSHIQLPQTKYNIEPSKQDNLKFYNQPIEPYAVYNELFKQNKLENQNEKQENFTQESQEDEHIKTVKHVLECEKCKNILLKQLNIETDRRRMEDIMEIVGYIIFSIFIVLLIEKLKK